MAKDTPTEEKSVRERGAFARHNDDPTLASYLSSLFFVLSVPGLILAAYAGHWYGLYGYSAIVFAFGGLFVTSILAAFTVMHVMTGR